jgi:hypothetical protein
MAVTPRLLSPSAALLVLLLASCGGLITMHLPGYQPIEVLGIITIFP